MRTTYKDKSRGRIGVDVEAQISVQWDRNAAAIVLRAEAAGGGQGVGSQWNVGERIVTRIVGGHG